MKTMKKTIALLVLVFLLNHSPTWAQGPLKTLDSLTTAKLSMAGFCLCKTELKDVTRLADDFKEVDLEEMEYPKNCYGKHGEYKKYVSVASEKFKGMIFQRGDFHDYLGRIRLTKDFSGKLPDGSFVDLRTMKLRDVFALYPELKKSWGSRGCSEYWFFSNQTVIFFVKIDKAVQPQFPINETYYLDKPVEGIDVLASCKELLGPTQRPLNIFKADEPMYFIDSIRTNQSFIEKTYQPSEIASIKVVKGDNAIKIAGQEGKNGIVYISSKSYVRRKYFRIFNAKSADFRKAVRSADDPDVVYILNGKVLKDNFEQDILDVAVGKAFEIVVLDKKQLKKEYGEKGKVGVILRTTK
jgi:hypothetical protein